MAWHVVFIRRGSGRYARSPNNQAVRGKEFESQMMVSRIYATSLATRKLKDFKISLADPMA